MEAFQEGSARERWSLGRLESFIDSLWERHVRHLLVCVGIFALFFFSEFSEYRLRVDDELLTHHPDALFWIAKGRWGTFLFQSLQLHPPLNPYFALLLFAVFLAASFLIFCRAVRVEVTLLVLASFALFAGFPVWHYIVEFKSTLFSNGVALFLASLAGASFGFKRFSGRLLFVILVAFCVSIYQSAVLVSWTVAVGAALRSKECRGFAAFARFLGKLFAVTLTALILYALIWKVSMSFAGLAPIYIADFFHPEELLRSPGGVLGRTACVAVSLYGGWNVVFRGLLGFSGLLFALGLASGLFPSEVPEGLSSGGFLLRALGLATLLLSPFLFHLVSGGRLPYRVLLAVPFVYWFVAYSAMTSRWSMVRVSSKLLAILVVLQFLQLQSYASFSQEFVAVHDELTASQVYERIVEVVDDFDLHKEYWVDFAGALPFPNEVSYLRGHTATTGSSVFEWDDGHPVRIRNYLGLLGMSNLRVITDRTRCRIADRVAEMPLWPAAGSVRDIDGIVVVRFGDYPDWIVRRMERLRELKLCRSQPAARKRGGRRRLRRGRKGSVARPPAAAGDAADREERLPERPQ